MREGHIQRKGHHDSFLCTCQCYGLAGGIEQEETSSGVVCIAWTIASPIGILFIVWIGWQPRHSWSPAMGLLPVNLVKRGAIV